MTSERRMCTSLLCRTVLAMPTVLFGSACVASWGGLSWSSVPAISPDGAQAIYLYTEFSGPGFDGELYASLHAERKGGKGEVRWCRLDDPNQVSAVGAPVPGPDDPALRYKFFDDIISVLRFSSDSRYVAVLSDGILSCVELATKRHWLLMPSDERISSFMWMDADTIAYASWSDRRRFFRQRVAEAVASRRLIYDVGPASEPTYPAFERNSPRERSYEHWSPSGRFAVYRSDDGQTTLLNVESGSVVWSRPMKGWRRQIAWKPDESAVFCGADETAPYQLLEAILVDTRGGKMTDVTEWFATVTGGCEWGTSIEEPWTPDGKYLPLECQPLGGYLLSLDTWEVIRLGPRLGVKLGPQLSPRQQWEMGFPRASVFWCPVPGWVFMFVNGWEYLVNYAGDKYVQLTDDLSWDFYPSSALTPDGRRAVAVTWDGRVRVKEIDLSAAHSLSKDAHH